MLIVFVGLSYGTSTYAQRVSPKPKPTKKVSRPTPDKKAPGGRAQGSGAGRSAVTGPAVSSGGIARGQIIGKILVEGQRKIEADAITTRIKSQPDQALSANQIREDIQTLFKTGYFQDIQVYQESVKEGPDAGRVNLIFKVSEKPSIIELIFEGNSEIKAEELQEASGLKNFEILNMTKVRDATDKIQKLYEDKGFFLARIDPVVEDVKKDESVKVTFRIVENDKVRVKKITFLGNQKIKDGALKGRIQTQEGGFFTFLSGSGAYKQEAFDRDVQILRLIYFSEGYVQVKIDKPQVYVTPDKKDVYITIRIEEGEQFYVGDIDFSGDLLFPRSELSEAIQINKQEIFSYETLQKDLGELQAKYGDLGYAFANIIPRTRINEKDRKVDVTFEFDKGNKVYFGSINVIGNSKTRDKVVRRELKIREGELYNETRRRQSMENIQRLGFFDEVNFKTSTPPEKPDVMNIEIAVKERNTGSIQLGAGYGSQSGFTLQGQVNQANFLGKGQKLSAGLNVSDRASLYNLNFTEPAFLDTEWSVGFDAYQSLSNRYEYDENRLGGAIRLGHPLDEFLFGSIRYRLDRTKLTEIYNGDGSLRTDYTLFPLDTASGITSSLTGTVEWDKRNDRFSPSKGIYASTSLEYAGLGGDLKYTKGDAKFRYFKKIFWEVVWRNNLNYSYISSHESGKEPPFNELFLLGGPYSLRGYQFFKVGKTRFSQQTYNRLTAAPPAGFGLSPDEALLRANVPFGGKQQLIYQTEFEFPLIAEVGIKGVTFFDIGQADDQITGDNFYSDVGFGFRWFSPIGPLRFEWGFPLKKLPQSDEPVVFEFSIGGPF